jgi:hypothetical protein
MNRAFRWTAVLGLSALFAGMMSLSFAPAAHADDWRTERERNHIRRDIEDVRRDERRLQELEDLLYWQRRHRDWQAARATERRISDLRRHIEEDRRDIRRDVNDVRRDRDRDYNRDYNRDRDYNRNQDRYYRDYGGRR